MNKNYTNTIKNTGMWIPEAMINLKELTWNEKILLLRIFYLSKTSAGCFASNDYLGQLLGVTGKTVQNVISDLRKRGFIYDVKRTPYMRWIKVSTSIEAIMNPSYVPNNGVSNGVSNGV